MTLSNEDYKAYFKNKAAEYAVVKDNIIINKGTELSSGGFLVDEEYVIEKTPERMDFLLSDRKQRSDYMDFYGIDNFYFYGDGHNRGEMLDTSEADVLAECLRILD